MALPPATYDMYLVTMKTDFYQTYLRMCLSDTGTATENGQMKNRLGKTQEKPWGCSRPHLVRFRVNPNPAF